MQNDARTLAGQIKSMRRKAAADSRMHAAELAHAKATAAARAYAKAATRNSDTGDGSPSVPRAPADRDPGDMEADTDEADDVLVPLGGMPSPAHLTITMTVQVFPQHSKCIFGSLHLRRLGLAIMDAAAAAVGCSSPRPPRPLLRRCVPPATWRRRHAVLGWCPRARHLHIVPTRAWDDSSPHRHRRKHLRCRLWLGRRARDAPRRGRNAEAGGSHALISIGQADLRVIFPAPSQFLCTFLAASPAAAEGNAWVDMDAAAAAAAPAVAVGAAAAAVAPAVAVAVGAAAAAGPAPRPTPPPQRQPRTPVAALRRRRAVALPSRCRARSPRPRQGRPRRAFRDSQYGPRPPPALRHLRPQAHARPRDAHRRSCAGQRRSGACLHLALLPQSHEPQEGGPGRAPPRFHRR